MRLRRTGPRRTAKDAHSGAGRHRSPAGEPQGADLTADHELESYLHAISPVRDPEITDPGRPFGNAKVYQLRLPPGAEEKVQWLAAQQGLSPLNMLQSWVLQRLHHEFSAPGSEPRE